MQHNSPGALSLLPDEIPDEMPNDNNSSRSPLQPELAPAAATAETKEAIAQDVSAVGQLPMVPKLLDILCHVTGMRFAAVARVTDASWTACAVKDTIQFGLVPGGQLDVKTTLCRESRAARAPIAIDHASTDPRYYDHVTPKLYKIESYVSVPIILPSGQYFGNLCAIDPSPALVSEARTLAMFEGFADLIAMQLEDELGRDKERRLLQDAHAVGALREQFIAILGHDLRNPLQAIYATGALLERRLTDSVLAAMATRIKANVQRMSALIDDVLDFAQGRLGGGIGVHLQDAQDVEPALVRVVEELQDANPDREILFEVNAAKPVRCDLARLQQLLSNLVANALTHGSSTTPVRVVVSGLSDDLVLEVWNAGEPIPADCIDKIFEPFWRQNTAVDRKGLGLGLHICAQIVRAHGGRLIVTSTSESGTRFIARLPLNGMS